LIVHVLDLEEARRYADFDEPAKAAARAFWPGPLTLVLLLKEESAIAPAVTAGLPTIALRSPAHPAMRDLLSACGRPLAAPSANASGRISPTTAEHVAASLHGRIPLVIDGGATARGLESTIVGIRSAGVRLLRPGPIDAADVAAAAGLPLVSASGGIEAPGQLASHYAPAKPLRLDVNEAAPDEWLIGFGPVEGDESLSASGDIAEAASRLFAALHRAEAQPRPRVAVAPIPENGIGAAINDRLRRAAAPRA
jgi:L-threonylcarbamoyladenylate synthase